MTWNLTWALHRRPLFISGYFQLPKESKCVTTALLRAAAWGSGTSAKVLRVGFGPTLKAAVVPSRAEI